MTTLPIPRDIGPLDYSSSSTPSGYHCGQCGALGVKLWREYQTFLNNRIERASTLNCHTEDDERGRGRIPLAQCDLGEWFCSEW